MNVIYISLLFPVAYNCWTPWNQQNKYGEKLDDFAISIISSKKHIFLFFQRGTLQASNIHGGNFNKVDYLGTISFVIGVCNCILEDCLFKAQKIIITIIEWILLEISVKDKLSDCGLSSIGWSMGDKTPTPVPHRRKTWA